MRAVMKTTMNLWFQKKWEISCLAERLLASEEGLCFMEKLTVPIYIFYISKMAAMLTLKVGSVLRPFNVVTESFLTWRWLSSGLTTMTHSPDGGSMHLWNVGKLLRDYTAQHPRRQPSSYSPRENLKSHIILFPTASTRRCFTQSGSFRLLSRWRVAVWLGSWIWAKNFHGPRCCLGDGCLQTWTTG
jgi:hypothetical protein